MLSVIMPQYNHILCVEESLNAILSQDFSDFEIILIDDASTDGSFELLQKYEKKFLKIKLYRNTQNKGPVTCINRGIDLAKGKYLAFCSADDKILPGFFSKNIKFLEENPEMQISTSIPCFFDDQNPSILKKETFFSHKPEVLQPLKTQKLLTNTNFWIASHSTIYRKKVILKYNKFNEDLKWSCDWYLNHLIAINETIGYLPLHLASFRIKKNSYSIKKYRENKTVFIKLFQTLKKEAPNIQKTFTKAVVPQLHKHFVFFAIFKIKYWKQMTYWILKRIKQKFITRSK